MKRFDRWLGRGVIAFWRWEYKHPDLAAIAELGGWLLVLVLMAIVVFLALGVPDQGLLVR